jgi:hypothetical protein
MPGESLAITIIIKKSSAQLHFFLSSLGKIRLTRITIMEIVLIDYRFLSKWSRIDLVPFTIWSLMVETLIPSNSLTSL